MSTYFQEAFNQTCKEAKQAQGWYVSLMENTSFYGGPEEGGWWGHDHLIVAYQYFPTEEEAQAAYDAVKKLAEELGNQAQKEHGEQCLREMEFLDSRGLDADYLPEPDGPSSFSVLITEGLPRESRACRHYE